MADDVELIRELRDMLAKVEWSGCDLRNMCPCCRSCRDYERRDDGHTNCKLAALLRRADERLKRLRSEPMLTPEQRADQAQAGERKRPQRMLYEECDICSGTGIVGTAAACVCKSRRVIETGATVGQLEYMADLDVLRQQAGISAAMLRDGRAAAMTADLAAKDAMIASLSERADAAESSMRSLASFLGTGGFNSEEFDAAKFEEKIRDGIDMITESLIGQIKQLRADLLTASERISQQSELLARKAEHPLFDRAVHLIRELMRNAGGAYYRKIEAEAWLFLHDVNAAKGAKP